MILLWGLSYGASIGDDSLEWIILLVFYDHSVLNLILVLVLL